MSFFDIVDGLLDIGKDIAMLPVEIGKAATELGNDLTEMVVQDTKNKISGESQKEIRTSYDIRDEAEKIIQTSKDKYIRTKNSLDSVWDDINTESMALSKNRDAVYKLMGQAIQSICLPKLFSPSASSIHYPTIPTLDSLQFDLGTYLGVVGTSMRMDAAEEYLQSAKEFRTKVSFTISQINCLKKDMLAISQAHKEEQKMLELIQSTYAKQSESILIQSSGILREISSLLLDEVTSQTAKKYQNYLEQLKTLWD